MVHEFFEIHGPWFFEIQCPKDFCDFGLFNRLAQAGGGGAYYMIFHYQKVTVLNYSPPKKKCLKLVCYVNIVYRNLKSDNSQDYAQKPERNCMFMNSASVHDTLSQII